MRQQLVRPVTESGNNIHIEIATESVDPAEPAGKQQQQQHQAAERAVVAFFRRQSDPWHSSSGMESEGEGEEAPTQAAAATAEEGGDEADLLALLQRLGLALSPSSSPSTGDNNGQASSRGGGGGGRGRGSSPMPRASKPAVPPPPPPTATATTAPAPINGSQAAPGVSAGKKVPGSAGAAEWAPWQSTHIQQQQKQKQVPSAGKRVSNQPPRRSGRRNGAGHSHSGHERSQSDGGVRPANRYPHRCGGGIGGNSSLDMDDPSQRVGMQVGTAPAAKNAWQSSTNNGGASSPSAAVGGGGVSTSPAQARGGSATTVSKNEGGGLGMAAAAAAATATEDGMVDLMRREITAREALLLGPILWAATGVTCLKLCYNHLRDGGAEAVSGAIERHPSLHTMDLGFNGITDQGAASLARGLAHNSSLRTLYLSGNSIGAAGAGAIADALARNTGLTTLHLSICDEGLAGLARAVARNSSIRLLELCFNRITAAGAEALAKSIWGTTGLSALRLDNNQVGDRGAQALAIALPTLGLETLDVGFSHVGTAGVAALMQATANSPSFTSLSLSGNALDAEAAKAIQAALAQPRCSLRCLYLDHTSLGRASEGFIANGVLSNRSLALVTLTGFRLGSSFARLGMPPQV
ncbi:unnamed protein product, partial [Ectocarpus sp. 8 AP-2014]